MQPPPRMPAASSSIAVEEVPKTSLSPTSAALATPRLSAQDDESASSALAMAPLALATSAVVSSSAPAPVPRSSREKLRREAAAALSVQLTEALSASPSREELEAVPDVASLLRVRGWLLGVLRKVWPWNCFVHLLYAPPNHLLS